MKYRIVEIYDEEYVIQGRRWWSPFWRTRVHFPQYTSIEKVADRLERIKQRAEFKRRVIK